MICNNLQFNSCKFIIVNLRKFALRVGKGEFRDPSGGKVMGASEKIVFTLKNNLKTLLFTLFLLDLS